MSDTPKPCPFCGYEGPLDFEMTQGTKWGNTVCPECQAKGPEVRTGYKETSWHGDAIAEWNNRTSNDDERAMIDVETLRSIVAVILCVFNQQTAPCYGNIAQIGEGRLAAILGVDLITANRIASMYADRLTAPTGHEWFDFWLTSKGNDEGELVTDTG